MLGLVRIRMTITLYHILEIYGIHLKIKNEKDLLFCKNLPKFVNEDTCATGKGNAPRLKTGLVSGSQSPD